MSRRQRIGHRQLASIQSQLVDTDWRILKLVADFRLLSSRQLQRLHFGDSATDARRARRRLHHLNQIGVVETLPRRIGGRGSGSDATVYRVGRTGHRLLNSSGTGPAWQPSANFAQHTLAIGDTYLDVHQRERTGQLQLLDFTPEPASWVDFLHQMQPVTLKPDARLSVVVDEVEHHYFLEVDLGTESLRVIERKLQRYLDYYRSGPDLTVFPQVLFLVKTDPTHRNRGTAQRTEQISRLLQRTGANTPDLFTAHHFSHPPWNTTDPDRP